MINLYTKNYSSHIDVKCSTVIGDILYVVVIDGNITDVIKLVRIDLSRMVEINSTIIDYADHFYTMYKFFGDKLYIYTTQRDDECEDDDYIDVEEVLVWNINTLVRNQFSVTCLKDIIEFCGNICYVVQIENVDIISGSNPDMNSVYYIRGAETNENFLTIIDYEDRDYFKNGVLYLSFGLNLYGGIYTTKDCMIFVKHDSTLVCYNNDTYELGTIGKLSKDVMECITVKNGKIYLENNRSYCEDIGNNKLFVKNTIFDYSVIANKTSDLNIFGSFKYDGYDYYIHTSKRDDHDEEYIRYKVFNIDVDINRIENDILVDNHPEYITIGSEGHNMKVSLPLIYNNSQFMQNLLDIKNIGTYEFINNNYGDIYLYINYLEGKEPDINTLDRLYKIASLMDDVNIEFLTFMILTRVKDGDVNIDIAWELLKTLYDDDAAKKFKILLYIIYKKYNRADFINKIANVNNMMYNKIIIDLILSRYV